MLQKITDKRLNSGLPGRRDVVKAPCHVTPILKFLHWLKINGRIEYKRLRSLTHKALTTAQYLSAQPECLISVQPPRVRATRFVVTLSTTCIFFS